MSASTIDAITSAYHFVQEHGPLSNRMFSWIDDQINATKKFLAEEFGGDPQSYALTQNATEGCNIVLWGLDWKESDVLLTTDSEHNGVMQAAKQLCKRKNLKLEICNLAHAQTDDEILAAVERSLGAKPRLFMVSHVLWNTGRLLPLREIVNLCRQRGVQVLADGAQSAGAVPLNFRQIGAEFYAITGHKWLGGPEGIGALYVAPEALESLEPTFAGWRSTMFDSRGNPTEWLPGAARFEVATSPFPLLSGIQDAIQVHRTAGSTSQRYEQILQNTAALRESLRTMTGVKLLDETGGSSLVSFVIANRPHGQIVRELENRKLIVRTIPNPDCIRASVHYFSADEADVFSRSLDEILRSSK